MVKKFLTLLMAVMLFIPRVQAENPPDEGMWLPLLLKQMNYEQMKKLGFKLSADDVYSVNKSSLKDAIVQLGGFCTAEVVSPKGLLFTNHHCAYDAIQSHSTPERDLLTDGFWSKNMKEELPVEGLTVSFLQQMVDVTDRIKKAEESDETGMAVQAEMAKIEEELGEEGKFKVEVEAMFYGNQHFAFVYQVYRDVRLVGAPPSSIGKFGGDTDNWMWPRHTGDFSILRVYADKDNNPADYSEDNVPYTPKHFLPISIKGVKEGDYAMVMGYPGSTDRYLTSFAIEDAYKNQNPEYVRLMGAKLEVMKRHMDADNAVRIALASNYASLANSYKYFKGQNRTLSHRGLIEERQAFEKEFMTWVKGDGSRKAKYGEVLTQIGENYGNYADARRLNRYLNFGGFGSSLGQYGIQYWRLHRSMKDAPDDSNVWGPAVEMLKAGVDGHFQTDYDSDTDKEVFATMARLLYNDLDPKFHPDVFSSKTFLKAKSKAKGDQDAFDLYADMIWEKSMLADPAKAKAFLDKPSFKVLDADPGVQFTVSIITLYISNLQGELGMFNGADEGLMKTYMEGMMEMQKGKAYYPDANFTMRVTYGSVKPYIPADAVSYRYYTTANGILEKELPGDEEFDVHPKLKSLIEKKDFGRYGKNGELVVGFLTDNDITGGNSGSPVIDGEGRLIGLAFDGNWESMASDLVFDEDIVRTICVDARYVLFVIDKFAGAKNIIDELKIVE